MRTARDATGEAGQAPDGELSLEARILRSVSKANTLLKSPVAGASGETTYLKHNEKVQKAAVADDTEHSNVLPSNDDVHTLFTMAGALFPPYDPEVLVTLHEHSNALRPNVDAYATNIEGFGHRLEPVIDLEKSDADGKIGDAIFLERLSDAELQGASVAQAPYPTSDDIAARKKEVAALMRLEHAKLANFFQYACAEYSFTTLRKLTRVDLEITGNAYWEVLRNANGQVTQFVYVPAYSIRLIPIEHKHHEYSIRQKVSALRYEPRVMKRRFRRFVQVVLDRIVHFKSFGDSRVVSRKTGREYPTLDDMKAADPHDGPATELIHFKIHSPRSPYGIPRWIGVLLAVMGSRASEEVNFLYFDNKAVPPLAILVSGGRLAKESVAKLESYVRDNLRGKENFHRILVVEAEAAGGASATMADNGRVRIALQPLAEAQQQDALFQNYDERNIDKVGMAFRMPRLLRGDVRDFNKGTAESALQFAEVQVFQPERQEVDDLINRHILTDVGIRFWTFVSQSPVNRDPMQVATMAKLFSDAGGLVPNDVRALASEAFNHEYRKLDDAWANQPLPLTVGGLLPAEDGGALAATPAPGTPDAPAAVSEPAVAPAKTADEQRLRVVATALTNLRAQLKQSSAKAFERATKDSHVHDDGTVVITLPKEEIDALFVPEAE